ncbi:clostripain-related cysteine peptidase [Butyrivibrio sp. FC2001]|uniref:clostripain-related cysteine peptidase n=1 Tax=Butyrivibrio sp. FC2001 TaxID=1280671 RepID=UPI00041BDB38|nr:clostripain-related cysteine peptidase [Butyrivibrio sp. FC2001]
MADKPVRRKKNIEDGGVGVHKRGEGLGGGPVGSSDGYAGRKGGSTTGGGGPQRSGGKSPLSLIVILAILLLGGGGGIGSLMGGFSGDDTTYTQESHQTTTTQNTTNTTTTTGTGSQSGSGQSQAGTSQMGSLLGTLLGGGTGYYGQTSSAWSESPNTGVLNREVAEGSRERRTNIIGDGFDKTTIMIYMCGTDLESRSQMATRDLQEMMAADISDNINIIVYTGGCKQWQNNVISSKTNQIYQVKKGGLALLKDNLGETAMTKPENLTGFIKWTAENFPANRYDLIFWDHGGGSVSGYGYDEKFAREGSMDLSEINKALKDSGITYDFIGFDACLMATVETALVASNYADYMIASEETEPGVGWYYTDWLNAYSKNPSMETIDLAKLIIDTYTDVCATTCRGQKTTLSLIDLAEIQNTVPSELKEFAKDTSDKISDKDYQVVANARSEAREFASSSKIDQVDLIHLASNMGTEDGKELADALKGCVKYNRTSQNMTNAYGLSIYFPYKKTSKVDSMVSTYEAIGMDDSYADCIQKFASMEVAGQVASGGTMSPMGSLFGDMSSQGQSVSSQDVLVQLFGSMMSSGVTGISGLDASNSSFFGKGIDAETMAGYVTEHSFDNNQFVWTTNSKGEDVIQMSEEQWSLVQNLDVNIFYDDGTGYVDLGLDNSYDIDDDGNPVAPSDRTWISINKQPVEYIRIDTQGDEDSYAIMGRVPCFINDVRANLILIFDSENEDGYVAGVCYDYTTGETETIAKNLTELQTGDRIDFVCDFYDYDENFQDKYHLGETLTVEGSMADLHISNTTVGDGKVRVTFKITDIYGQEHWTPAKEY